jgi:hypothetical protein
METRIMNIQSREIFENRKDAKERMGHSKFNRALRDGNILFLNTYSPSDILI